MAYADQHEMSTGRMVSIGLVVLLHVGVGYALVTGLAYDATKQVFEDLKTFDVEEEKPEEPEKPPPPPEKLDIPPPPKVVIPPPTNITPIITTNPIITAPQPITPTAPPAPPTPPAPPAVASRAELRSGSITDDDYPPSASRNEEQGVSVARFTVGPDGRVGECSASGASPALDALTCTLIKRRFRYKPAKDAGGNAISETKSQRVNWKLPK